MSNNFKQFMEENKEGIYKLAEQNTTYNEKGQAVITKDDEWRDEIEWDEFYNKMNNLIEELDYLGVNIIIPTYNTKQMTSELVESIYKYEEDCWFNIIVIDNGNDGTGDYIQSLHEEIQVIKNPNNASYAKSVNQGIMASQYEYILILNSDMLFTHAGTLQELIHGFDYTDKVACVTGKLVNQNNQIMGVGVYGEPNNPKITGWLEPNSPNKYAETRACTAVCGACMMIKRSLLPILGYFDEYYPHYYEETDYCYNIIYNGYKCVYTPKATIIHYHMGSCKDKQWLDERFCIGRKYFLEKWQDKLWPNREYLG